MFEKMISALALAMCVAALSGCATPAAPVSIWYSPSVGNGKDRGDLFLKTASDPVVAGGAGNVRWVIGKREDASGTVTGEILSANSANDTVLYALKAELTAAGYRVALGPSLPAGISRGLELDAVQVEVKEKFKFPKIEATGKVGLSLKIWKNGSLVKKLNYRTENSDFAVLHGDRLPRELIEQGLGDVMRQAVPDIIKVLEERP